MFFNAYIVRNELLQLVKLTFVIVVNEFFLSKCEE